MTLATLAPLSGNFVVTGFALSLVIAFIFGAILWKREGQMDRHDDTLAEHDDTLAVHDRQLATLAYQMPKLLEHLGIEIPEPVADDSPEAMAEAEPDTDPTETTIELPPNPTKRVIATVPYPDDLPTDEFPIVQPDTAPMALVVDPTPAVQARRDAAWDVRRPSPVPRKSAEWVEAELQKIRARSEAAHTVQVIEEAS